MVVCRVFIVILSSITAEADDIRDVIAPSLGENEAAFMFLSYSGLIIRIARGTVIIDLANLLKDEKLEIIQEHGIDLVLFTHGHSDHHYPDSTFDLFDATDAPILAESSVANSLKEAAPLGIKVCFVCFVPWLL